jgi:hypothetical protein
MSNSNIPQTSQINLFPEIVYDKDQVAQLSLDVWNAFDIKVFPKNAKGNPYLLWRPVQSDTLPGLAQTFYKSDRLWWITLLINEVEDPFSFLDDVTINGLNGGVIKILKMEYIPNIIFEMKRLKAINDTKNEMDPNT